MKNAFHQGKMGAQLNWLARAPIACGCEPVMGAFENSTSNNHSDQFSFLGNRARYEFIELDMSTVLALSIPSSRPLTFPGGKSKNSYRAR